MTDGFLLSRVLLSFEGDPSDILGDLSAVALTPDGYLWVASDETTDLERLSPIGSHVFGNHKQFALENFVELSSDGGEIDIEGMEYADHYLWLIGSHSTKRKKPKGKNPEKDLSKLTEVKTEPNRYLLARIPVSSGELVKSCPHPTQPEKQLTAACIEKRETSNLLTEALTQDPHLGPFLAISLPSKENGFDIEGLTVRGNRAFIGLRGPVLRGWAIILEIEITELESGSLGLKAIGPDGESYKKHFVDLGGLGVRELCLHEDNLLILAGPTMDLSGALRVFQLKNALDRPGNNLFWQDEGDLEVLFDIPFVQGADKAEGMAIFPCLNQEHALLVVYDDPSDLRKVKSKAVFADVFQLR